MKGVLTRELIESATNRLQALGSTDEADALRELWRLWVENREAAASWIVTRSRRDPDDDPDYDYDPLVAAIDSAVVALNRLRNELAADSPEGA